MGDDDSVALGSNPVVPEVTVASEIRRLRAAAGLSQNQLADLTGYTRQYVSRAERLTGGYTSADLVRALDTTLAAGGALISLHAAETEQRVARRKSASSVADPASGCSTAAPVDRNRDGDERSPAALMRPSPSAVGPREHRAELERLLRIDQQHGAEQAAPAVERLLSGIGSSLADSRGSDRAVLLRTAARSAEFAGFLFRDLGSEKRCLYWHDRAMEFAQQADDGPMQAYILLRKAQAAYDRRDAPRMFDLTLAASRFSALLGPGLRAEITQQRARGEAMLGASGRDVQKRLDDAYLLLASVTGGDVDEPGCHYSRRLLDLQSALCLSDAGRPRDAVQRYRAVIGSDLSPRDHAYFSILMATALALSGEPDEAARIACAALPTAVENSSRRSLQEAWTLAAVLAPWGRRDGVRELHDALRSASCSQPA